MRKSAPLHYSHCLSSLSSSPVTSRFHRESDISTRGRVIRGGGRRGGGWFWGRRGEGSGLKSIQRYRLKEIDTYVRFQSRSERWGIRLFFDKGQNKIIIIKIIKTWVNTKLLTSVTTIFTPEGRRRPIRQRKKKRISLKLSIFFLRFEGFPPQKVH